MGDDLARAAVRRAFVEEQLLRGRNVCVLSGSMVSAGGVRKSIEGVYRGRLTALSITDNPSGARGDLLVLDAVQSPDSALNVELLMGRIRNALRTIKPVQVVALYLPAHDVDVVKAALVDWDKKVVTLDLTSVRITPRS